jgi:O-antigen/teichoic acid export membrane protein
MNLKEDLYKGYLHLNKHGFWVLGGNIIQMILSILLSIILTNYLTQDSYGKYKYILSIFSLFAFFSLPGSRPVLIKFITQGFDFIYDKQLYLRLKYSIIGSISLILLSIYYYSKDESEYSFVFLLLSLIYPFYYSFNIFGPPLHAKLNYRLLNILLTIKSIIRIVIITLSLIIFRKFYYVLIIFAISETVINICYYYYVRAKFINEEKIDKKIVQEVKKISIKLSIAGILPLIALNLDKIMIANAFDYSSLAIFYIGILIGTSTYNIFKPLMNTLNAKLVHKKLEFIHYFVLFITGTIIGLIATLILPKLILFVYGDNYANSFLYCKGILYSLGLFFVSFVYYNQIMYNKSNSFITIYLSNIIVPVIQIIYVIIVIYFSGTNIVRSLILLSLLLPLKHLLNLIVLISLRMCKFSYC